MLNQNIEKLQQLRFYGMLNALQEQLKQSDIEELDFSERLALLLDYEITIRADRRLKTKLRKAKLKQQACIENIDFKQTRGLDKSLILTLSSCKWIKDNNNILIAGATGTGKTYLACAFAHKACLEGYSARYLRLSRLFQELLITKGDGRYIKFINQLAKTDVLVLDDLGLQDFNNEQRRDLLEIFDDRHNKRSTIVTSQLPFELWHKTIGDPTLADAILDRIIHNAYKIQLKGESMRKKFNSNIENNLTNGVKIVNN